MLAFVPSKAPWARMAVVTALALFLVLVPLLGTGYHYKLLTLVFMSIALAEAWNLLGGFAGYISFGHVAFFGLGGYATAILMAQLQWPFALAALGGSLIVALFALVLGTPLLRVRGHYFAVVTFAVGEVMRELANNLNFLTGGGMGLQVPLFPGGVLEQNRFFYFVMLALMAATIVTTYFVARSRVGYGLRAIREDEDVASALGVNVGLHKVAALVLSAFFVGVAGSIYAYWVTFLEPADLFSLNYSVNMVIMAVLGGSGTVLGPVLGAVVVMILNEVLWSNFLELHNAFLGLVLIAVVMLMPRGLLDFFRRDRKTSVLRTLRLNLQRYRV
jgi:branched-chain amino acid transport system permease protein